MVAVKKLPSTRTDLERNFHLDHKESKPPSNFAGFIFLCSNETIPDLESRIFGLPLAHLSSVRAIKQGMPLFLFNYSTRRLCGVFEAASDGGLNLNPCAWENVEVRKLGKAPVSRYPAQVRVNLKFQRPPLDEETFRPVLDHVEGHKFRLELTAHQVKQLLRLFAVPEKEFFGEKTKKWPQGTGIGTYLPDSPRSAFKSDSDCYSECSSKGTYYGEDDWVEEDKTGKNNTQVYLAHGNSEPYLNDELSHLSLNGMASTNYKIVDENPGDNLLHDTTASPGMPFFLHGSKMTALHGQQQSALKENIGRNLYSPWPGLLESRDVNQVLSRFHEADPAVNSNPIYALEAGGTQPHSDDEAESLPYVPHHVPSPYLGCEIYIPAQTQPRRSEQKKLDASTLASKQGLNSENHDKLLNYRAQQKLLHQHYPIYLPGTQYGHVLLPFCAARPGSVYDSNHMAAMLSPVLLSPLGQGVTFAHPQLSTLDQIEEGKATLNNPQMHAGGYPNILQNGQFQVLLLPSVIPRVTPNAPPFAVGFIEALHFNILQFTRLTRPSAERQLLVEAAIDSIQSCVRTVWPDADVEVFGSFATGLCLQHSDVDLAVIDAPLLPSLVNMTTSQASSFLLRELGSALKASKCCDSYNVIANASVPVLKCYCRPIVKMSNPSFLVPSVAIDITIGGIRNSSYEWKDVFKGTNVGRLGSQQHTGGAAREYVLGKVRELPALAPLVLLMKSFLHHKGLSNVYMGGLGSFSLTLLLAYYLERAPLSEEGAADRVPNNVSAAAQIAVSPVSSLSDFAEEFDVPLTKIMGDNFYSSYKSEGADWSLGEYYVRKAAIGIEKVLAFWDAGGVAPLGKLLLGFLRTFGFERDLAREKIILKGMNGRPGGIVKRDNRHIALWIDDPLRPGVNVAAGSFGMCQVQAAFREMHWALLNGQPLTAPLQCDEKDCEDLAAFAKLPQLSRLLTDAGDHYEQD